MPISMIHALHMSRENFPSSDFALIWISLKPKMTRPIHIFRGHSDTLRQTRGRFTSRCIVNYDNSVIGGPFYTLQLNVILDRGYNDCSYLVLAKDFLDFRFVE